MSANLFTSNRFEALADLLFHSSRGSFGRKIVVVHSETAKKFLQNHFLERSGVCFGLQFLSVGEALSYLLELLGTPAHFASATQLFFYLESFLRAEGDSIEPLRPYLKKEKSLRDLADQLSRLFLRYSKEDGLAFEAWKESGSWQSQIFKKVFSHWDDPASFLKKLSPRPCDIELEIHLFGLCPLKPLQLAYFNRFSAIWPTYIYALSASRHYLGDELTGQTKSERKSSLLTHFGLFGVKMQKCWLDLGWSAEELFVRHTHPKTQLEHLQSALLEAEPLTQIPADDSIQLHACPSKLREVEIFKMVAMNLMQEQSDLEPKDFLILAPDISSYQAHIALTFSGGEIAFEVNDLPLLSEEPAVKALFAALALVKSAFDRRSVMSFFSHECVQLKRSLSNYNQFSEWLEKSAVRFGMNKESRTRFLQRFSATGHMALTTPVGTFDYAFYHLIMGLVMPPDDESEDFAAEIIDFSQAEALGEWIIAIQELYQAIQFMEEKALTIREWHAFLSHFIDSFIEKGSESLYPLMRELESAPELYADELYQFDTIKMVLDRASRRSSGRIGSSDLNALRFGTLRSGGAAPAKVIYLMGMEGFPKTEVPLSLDTFKPSAHALSEEDRMLFLELILCAQRHFILSYVALSSEDGKRQPPSLFIDELKRALHGSLQSTEHLAYRFHPHYFSTSRWKNFSEKDFAALIYQKEISKEMTRLSLPAEKVVKLKSLENLARNPFKFFLNEAMGIYFPFETDSDESEFLVPAVELARLRRLAIEGHLSLEAEARRGHLPVGVFQELIKQDLEGHIQTERAWTVEFKAGCEAPYSPQEGVLVFPPLYIDDYTLIGKLPPINSSGLLSRGKKSLEERLKIWPLFLVYLQLPLSELGFQPKLLYLEGEESYEGDALSELRTYLHYYDEALQVPSPLHPQILRDFFKGGEAFSRKMSSLESDHYLTWLQGAHYDLSEEHYYEYWKRNDTLSAFASHLV